MSFENATSWPPELLSMFAAEREGSHLESRYYAPYNKLLHWMFPSWDFLIVPHAIKKLYTKDRSIYYVSFLVKTAKDLKPVLLFEMKDDSYITKGSTRGRADRQMRILFNDHQHEGAAVPIMYGISALGTTLRVYQADTATFRVWPTTDPSISKIILPPGYLENEWSLELLSQEGFDEMKRIATNITSESSKARATPNNE